MRPDEVHRMLTPDSPKIAEGVATRRTSARRRWRQSVLTLAMMLAAYVLSIGPLYWKWYGANSGVGSPIYKLIYWPLEELAYQLPTVGRLLNWYVSLWIY